MRKTIAKTVSIVETAPAVMHGPSYLRERSIKKIGGLPTKPPTARRVAKRYI